MTDPDQQRWDELHNIYLALRQDLMDSVRIRFSEHYPKMDKLPALELALEDHGLLPYHPLLDGAQEYDDTLAGQEIFEALKEG